MFSFKNPGENYSFSIKAENAKYIWTRFDMHNNNLVIKIKHGLEKTEFAIPIVNYCQKGKDNWLYAFYRMIMAKNINIKLD